VSLFCRDLDAIEAAVRRQLTRLEEFSLHPDRDLRHAGQDIMNQVARARTELVNPVPRLMYDQKLAGEMNLPAPAEIPMDAGVARRPRPAPGRSPAAGGGRLRTPLPLHRRPKEDSDLNVQFEAIVWEHMGRWRLNDQERRLLLAEAFALGLPAPDALKILDRMDAEAEVVVRQQAKVRTGWAVTLTAALGVLVLIGAVMFLVLPSDADKPDRRDDSASGAIAGREDAGRAGGDKTPDQAAADIARKKLLAGILESADSLGKRGLLDEARRELDKVTEISPHDARLQNALGELKRKREEVSSACTEARSLIARGQFARARAVLERIKPKFPEAPSLAGVYEELAGKRKAVAAALSNTLLQVKTLIAEGKLDRAEAEFMQIDPVHNRDPEHVRLRTELAGKVERRREEFEKIETAMLSHMSAGRYDAAEKSLAEMTSIWPGNRNLPQMRKRLDARIENAAKNPRVAALEGHVKYVRSIAFSPDGKRLISGGGDNKVKIWDVETRCPLGNLVGHEGSIGSVAFSSNGRLIASGSYDKTVRIWDASTGRELKVLKGHGQQVGAVAFSRDSKRLISCSADKTVKAWDIASGRDLGTLRTHKGSVWFVAASPDRKRFASGSRDKTVKIWGLDPKLGITTLEGHKNWVYSVAFSPDGRRLASGSYDMTVRIWDVAAEKEIRMLKGHKSYVYSVAYSPDGALIASGSWDKTVRIWRAGTGRPVAVLTGHEGPVNSVAFSPDGKRLASGSNDKTIRLWNVRSWTRSSK